MLIYPDTNIWNYLAQRHIDERKLTETLATKNATLVLSAHHVYELARTFTGKAGTERGVQLFSSIKKFLDLKVPCSKEVMEFLKEECYVFENGLQRIDPMLDASDHETVRREVDKLARGIVEGRVKEFIAKRTQFAVTTRVEQRDHFTARKTLKRELRAVSESDLFNWLQSVTMTTDGSVILSRHLERMLGPGPTPDYARRLLLSPASNAARGLVRADLYSNWRSANRGSNPKDLVDDMLHVLQSIYCDLYVTGEPDQAKYAGLLLTTKTKVRIYDGMTPIGQWLVALA